MSRKSRGLPKLLNFRYELVLIVLVMAAVPLAYWFSGSQREVVADWVQIAFWVSASTVAWLTYINARRGILQPLRTEVFKSQLEALKDVQALFVAKNELELHAAIALDEVVRWNADRLLGDYTKVHFCSMYKCDPFAHGDAWRPIDSAIATEIQKPDWFSIDCKTEAERRSFWALYRTPGVFFPKAHIEGCERIRQVLEHPLLPTGVRESLEAYMAAISRAVDILTEVLNRCAFELPQKYATLESIDHFTDGENGPAWIWNSFYRELGRSDGSNQLRRHAAAVVQAVRDYLQVEHVQQL